MTRNEFLERAHNQHGYKYKYIDLSDKLILSDKIIIEYNNVKYKQRVSKHLMGKCPEKNTPTRTTEQFIIESKEVWGNKYDYSLTEYKGALIDVKIIYDGIVYLQRPTSHLKGMAPEFRRTEESIINDEMKKMDLFGETEIHNFLRKYKIVFKEKHRLDKVTFDFYLPSLRVCIEFDGRQHFEPIEKFGGVPTLERIKLNDKVKNEYCEEHYIELVRIKYDKIDDIYRILWDNLAHKIKKTN
jgi:very-short-patch-repair endonuclease